MKDQQNILDAVANYEKSRIILTACELDLFTHIHGNAATAKELAETVSLNLAATTKLLDCLVTFGLLSKQNDHYMVTEAGKLLSAKNLDNILPFIKAMNDSWNKWHQLTEIVRNGSPPQEKNKRKINKGINKDFIEYMHHLGSQLSAGIAEIYHLDSFKRMLDIGGASGTSLLHF